MIIKAKLNSDIRRITINEKEFCQLPFTRFCEIISTPFGLGAENIIVKYKDEEGDLVFISTDLEFEEAKKFVNAIDPSIFRIQLFIKAEKEVNDAAIKEFVEVVVPFLKSNKFRRMVGKVITNYERVYSNSVVYTENNKEIPAVITKESNLPEIKSQPPLVSVPTQVPVSVASQPKLETKVEEKQEKLEIKDLNLKQKHLDEIKQELIIEKLVEYDDDDEDEDEGDVKLSEALKTENITIPNPHISPNIIVQPSIVNTTSLSTLEEHKLIFNSVPQTVSISQPAISITNPQIIPTIVQNPPIVINATAQIPVPMENKKKPILYCQFVSDVTIKDRTILTANEDFQKTWRIKNSSDIPLQNCFLTYIGGEKLYKDTESVPVVGPVAVKEEFDVSVKLRAPSQPGRYISYYQMATQTGEKFGHRVWVDIQVDGIGNDEDTSPIPIQNDSEPSFPKIVSKSVYGDQKYANSLAQLVDMGFDDYESNLAVLTAADGNLQAAIQTLLGNTH